MLPISNNKKDADISHFPEDIQKVLEFLPIGDNPSTIELSKTTAGISIDTGMLFLDNFEMLIKHTSRYSPFVSVRNGKLMLVFTLGLDSSTDDA